MDRRFKLTYRQLLILRTFQEYCYGGTISSMHLWRNCKHVSEQEGVDLGRNYRSKLARDARQLIRRGFLAGRRQGTYRYWNLGPMSDHLMDLGVLK